ncbi:MAG: murein biosynthesis integral membrane protein MurJ, partial [Actinomycetota bacterium]|nr:murein biosynthesis integral membrane protein MurJ [Actinomycetota bacterium]
QTAALLAVRPDGPGMSRPPVGDAAGDLARHTAVMAAGTMLSRVSGFGRLAALTAALGVAEGPLADAFNTANVMPNIVYELVLGGVLSSVLVPVFVDTLRREAAHDGDAGEHRHVVNTVTTLAGLVLVVIVVAAVAGAPLLARLLTVGVQSPADPATLRRVVTVFLRLFLPQVLFYGLTTIWTAYLNAHRHFATPMFAPVLNNVIVAGVVLVFGATVGFEAVALQQLSTAQLWLLGGGTTAGIVAMTVPLWPVARRHGWSWRPSLDWGHPMVRRIGRLGGWAVLYVLVNQVGYLVVIVLAGAVPGDGAFSAYVYAFMFFQLPHGIYAVSVMTALVPALSESASAGDLDRFRAQLTRGVRATALLIVPAAVGLGVLAAPIIRLLLEQGVFSAASTQLVSRVLVAFTIGLPSFSLFQLFLRAHYALQNTRTPALVNLFAVGLNIAVDVVLFVVLPGQWKVVGLAVGHASAYTAGALVFALRLHRRLGGLEDRATLSSLSRIAGAAALMGGLAWGAAQGLAATLGTAGLLPEALTLGGAVAAGVLAYLTLARLLGVGELKGLTALARPRLGRRSPPA